MQRASTRPQTNGVAERSVQEAIQGARTLLQQAGAPTRWWSKAIRHYCFMHNVCRVLGLNILQNGQSLFIYICLVSNSYQSVGVIFNNLFS